VVTIDLRISSVDDLVERLERGRRQHDGEAVDLLAHALQTASLLAYEAPGDVELQVAGLVHDIGTLMEPNRPAAHARTGAAAVEALLGARVADLVGAHDDAKRYLVAVEPRYAASLSTRSIATLDAQGGPMSTAECSAFRARADFEDLLRLRRADDAAKVPGAFVPGLEEWTDALHLVAGIRTRTPSPG
jgi:predicted HD phosphohydrolase